MTESMPLVGVVLLSAVPLLPLLFAVLVLLSKKYSRVARFAPWGALPGLIFAFGILPEPDFDLPWINFGSSFAVDDVGAAFLLVTSIVWLMGGLQMAHSRRRFSRLFTGCFYLAMAGNMGVLVAADMPSFYLFFAIMSFAAYCLIVEDGTEQATRAGRIYMVLVIIGEVALFAGLTLIASNNGSLDLRQLTDGQISAAASCLVFAGFGIKAGLVPVHFSLPLAYTSAPSPARFVLAGAMLNAGICGWLRFLPMEATSLPGWGGALMFVGVISIFYGMACGLGQKDARTLLAYSSISQIGYVVMLLGAGLAGSNPASVAYGAILLFAIHHSLAKAALFWGYDLWIDSDRSRISRAVAGTGLLVAAAALAGAPFTSGALAKSATMIALTSPQDHLAGTIAILLPFGAIATTLLMVRFLLLCRDDSPLKLPITRVSTLLYTVLIGLVTSVAWLVGADGLDRMSVLQPAKVWAGTWPVLGGIAFFFICRPVIRAVVGRRGISVPPGDIVLALEKGATVLKEHYGSLSLALKRLLDGVKTEARTAINHLMRIVPVQALPWKSSTTGAILMTILIILVSVSIFQ